MENIQNAFYTIVWDNGSETNYECMVNMDTKEVFDIEVSGSNNVDADWVDQYITLPDGTEWDVHSLEYCQDYCGDDDTSDWYWFQ